MGRSAPLSLKMTVDRKARAAAAKRHHQMTDGLGSPKSHGAPKPPRYRIVKKGFMAIFSAVDKDGSGALDKKEIKDAMMTMAKHAGGAAPIPADAETIDAGLKEMFGAIDIDGDGTLDFDELFLAFRSPMPENLEETFESMDEEEFNEGFKVINMMAEAFKTGDFSALEGMSACDM